MPELNLRQITDKLNAEFSGEGHKQVFWYDDQAEFAEEIESLEKLIKQLKLKEPKICDEKIGKLPLAQTGTDGRKLEVLARI